MGISRRHRAEKTHTDPLNHPLGAILGAGRPRWPQQIGETFWLVVKATADGGDNFVVSFRRADVGNLRSLRRSGVAVPIGDLEALIRDAEARQAARLRQEG